MNPWTSETAKLGAPVLWRFGFVAQASSQELWGILLDTTRINRAMGLGAMEYVEENGISRGSTRTRGIEYRWTELPWAWISGLEMACFRIYDNGLATHGRIQYRLVAEGPARSRLEVELAWYPRNALARWTLPVLAPLVRAAYQRALDRLGAELASERPRHELLSRPARPLSDEARGRVAGIRERLLGEGLAAPIVDALLTHVDSGDELDLARLRVRPLARRLRLDERELLRVCLHATRAGLLEIAWDLICPHCRGVRFTAATLGDVPGRASCAACEVELTTEGPNAVEITFQIHPSIRVTQRRAYCLSEASTKAHILLQQPLDPGERRTLATTLPVGRYRARVIAEEGARVLDIVPGPPGTEIALGEAGGDALEAGPSPTVTLVNSGKKRRIFVIEDVQWTDDALRPAHLFNLPDFRDLFSTERLAPDVQLHIGDQTILFSDMVGSTRFYLRHGDLAAFVAVKQHFREVFAEIEGHRGVVVKTMGDAVMAAFFDPSDALRAARGLQRRFPVTKSEPREEGIRLRISLAAGPCIAVNLSQGIDYFGRTVNLAAKLQACVSSGQIAFPAVLQGDPRVEAVLVEERANVEQLDLTLPSGGDPVRVCRWDTGRDAVSAQSERR
ncbi:MAG: DUF5939 domain-containing protein [Byssovorax sp.]